MAKKREKVEAGSGDVFTDLGFADAGERGAEVRPTAALGAVAATATFPATVASHSAQRNCLSLQYVRLYYRRRRHSTPHHCCYSRFPESSKHQQWRESP